MNKKATALYPNPMSDVLHIKGDNIVKVAIFNTFGQEVMAVENRNEIDVTSLLNGLYFIKTTNSNGNATINKVVKK